MPVDTIVFDLGRVIIDFDMEPAIRTIARYSSMPREPLETLVWDTGWVRRYEQGLTSLADFYRFLAGEAGLHMDYESFRRAWCEVFAEEMLVPEQLLRSLSARYRMVLLSNSNEAHVEFIAQRYPVFDYFPVRLFSHEVHALKPDPAMYRTAIATSGSDPDRLFYTDDRTENIEAAQSFGIRSHLFDGLPGLLRALDEQGIRYDG